ncbi:MAG: hypothetical protein IJG36_11605 [Synergistaceae bacterium]|nr:hypothetical protein [Synergistaceae bacterium]
MDTRDSKGRFTKGSIGNPKGRPKKEPEPLTPKEVLENATMQAVTRLIDLVHSENEVIALQASLALLDRTWGTPQRQNTLDLCIPSGLQKMTTSWQMEDNSLDMGTYVKL